MMVIILSMAALAVVTVIAAFASRWDKKQPPEDPDLRAGNEERRAAVLSTAAIAGMKNKKPH
ncbi:MAG: hypothetical protein K1X35_09575 [Caulobacteraceae bacterium]|nr:hypothetical protein [Caulobacteraceae bacterium]